MNLTGNGNVSSEDLELTVHNHSGTYKRHADNYAAAEREEKRNESVRN